MAAEGNMIEYFFSYQTFRPFSRAYTAIALDDDDEPADEETCLVVVYAISKY